MEPIPAEPAQRRPRRTRTARAAGAAPAGYAQAWALFADWCAATDHQALPADPATVLAFMEACPAATATQRRRVAAIDYHHTTTDDPAPGDHFKIRTAVGRPPREKVWACPDRGVVDTALRALPSHGFTAGLFGQRDRALLVLAQLVALRYRAIADLIAADLQHDPDNGTVIITVAGRTPVVVDSGEDVVVCPACALTRWLRTHAVLTRHIATQPLITHLHAVEPVTDASPHDCRQPTPAGASAVPLLPPINQWGHIPFPATGLSRHAVSRQTRDLLAGDLRIHRDLTAAALEEPTIPAAAAPHTAPQPRPYGAADRDAAWNRRRQDIRELATVAADLDEVERRAAELNQRVAELLAGQPT